MSKSIRSYFQTTKGGVMCVEVFDREVTICAARTRAAARHTVRSWRTTNGRRGRRGRVGEATGLASISDLRRAIQIAEQIATKMGLDYISVAGCTPRLDRIWRRALRNRHGWNTTEDFCVFTP